MALPGELNAFHPTILCDHCKQPTPLRVLKSRAGWYLGYVCCSEPISRETAYYATEALAQRALDAWLDQGMLPAGARDTCFHPDPNFRIE